MNDNESVIKGQEAIFKMKSKKETREGKSEKMPRSPHAFMTREDGLRETLIIRESDRNPEFLVEKDGRLPLPMLPHPSNKRFLQKKRIRSLLIV